jgi:hypothetical protein
MGMPLLIGAGIGAISSAAMGKSPFTGALLGGATGGMLGGAGGLFGAAPTAGVSGLASVAPAAATAGEIAIPSTSLLGAGTTASSVGIPASSLSGGITNLGMEGIGSGLVPNAGVQLSSNALAGGLDYGINAGNTLAGGQSIYQAPSFMDRLSNIPENAMNYVKNNPMSAGKMVLDVATPTPQQPIQPSQGQVSRPNFDPSSTLLNVSPNVRPTAGSKTGLIDMMAHIPMTDEERMRLQQLGYRG